MSDLELLPWSLTLKIIACAFHGVAIACTVFRLMYRWYMSRFWWEDGWAAFALAVDILCLVSAWLEPPTTAQGIIPPIDRIINWMTALGFTSVLWSCRISILFSIVRVTNPSQHLRRIAFFVGCSFIIMWAAIMAQKIRICQNTCVMAASVGLSQLITTVMADVALVALPVWCLRQTRLRKQQRTMLFSVFSASLLIPAITVFHSIVLFTVTSSGIIVIGHVRIALSLIICNLLVIVTFMYRVCRRGKAGDLDTTGDLISLTNVDLNTGFTESADKQAATTAETLEEVLDSERSCSTA